MSSPHQPSAPTSTPAKLISRFAGDETCSEAKILFHERSPNDFDRYQIDRLEQLAPGSSPASQHGIQNLFGQVRTSNDKIDTLVMRLIKKEVDRQEDHLAREHWKKFDLSISKKRIEAGWKKRSARAAELRKGAGEGGGKEQSVSNKLKSLREHVPPVQQLYKFSRDKLGRAHVSHM